MGGGGEREGTPDFAPIWNLLYCSFNRELGNLSVSCSKLCRIWVVLGWAGKFDNEGENPLRISSSFSKI